MISQLALGIDLGTSNSAMALFAPGFGEPEVVEITQLISAGRIAERPTLPSATYIPSSEEFSAAQLDLPWPMPRQIINGAMAREIGTLNPDRLAASAKSWLCFHQVDPQSPILPWRSDIAELKISPVEASAEYLSHMLASFRHQRPQISLDSATVVVTVPASFDEAARSLTLEAAARAGIPNAVLLEEPVAAFYSWISASHGEWRAQINPGDIVLICDVGGGTADFTLVVAVDRGGELGLERIAVGDHILLGGDNMDLALAQAARNEFERSGARLDRWQFLSLVHGSRSAKEKMLNDISIENLPVALPSRGSSLFQKTVSGTISRSMIEQVILEGFFPLSDLESFPDRSRVSGLQEFGLPYAADPALSRHLAQFLVRARERVRLDRRLSELVGGYLDLDRLPYLRPTAVLFNGGVFNSPLLRKRTVDLLDAWSEETAYDDSSVSVRELAGADLDLAVARGAAFYGNLINTGEGLRIRTGLSRSYYIGVGAAEQAVPGIEPRLTAICVVPQGTEEGADLTLNQRQFGLRTGEQVEFRFFSASHRTADTLGTVVEDAAVNLDPLPSLRLALTPVDGQTAAGAITPVQLHAKVTELGLLELWLNHTASDAAWRLSFNLRSESPDKKKQAEVPSIQSSLPPQVTEIIGAAFGKKRSTGDQPAPKGIVSEIEEALRLSRDEWDLPTARAITDLLSPGLTRRGRSLIHETSWLNLAGWTARPGFGHSGDGERISSLWRLFSLGLSFPREARAVVQWWIFWRRIAGGLDRQQQEQLFDSGIGLIENGGSDDTEVVRCLASLERIGPERKLKLGSLLVRRIEDGKAGAGTAAAALGRLGSRILLYGGPRNVLAGDFVFDWFKRLENLDWVDAKFNLLVQAFLRITKLSNSPELNLAAEQIAAIRQKLISSGAAAEQLKALEEVVGAAERDQAQLFGESLPAGLVL